MWLLNIATYFRALPFLNPSSFPTSSSALSCQSSKGSFFRRNGRNGCMNFEDIWDRDPYPCSPEDKAHWTVTVSLLHARTSHWKSSLFRCLDNRGGVPLLSSQSQSSSCERHRAKLGGVQSRDTVIQCGHPAPDCRGLVFCFRHTYSPFQSVCDSLSTGTKHRLCLLSTGETSYRWNSYSPTLY